MSTGSSDSGQSKEPNDPTRALANVLTSVTRPNLHVVMALIRLLISRGVLNDDDIGELADGLLDKADDRASGVADSERGLLRLHAIELRQAFPSEASRTT